MAKKLTYREKNNAKLDDLLKQKVSTGDKGFLAKNLKQFIAEELIHAANNQKRSIKKSETLQQRYNRFKPYYDKLFTTGMSGNAMFTGSIEKKYKQDKDKGITYYIRENGKEKAVSHAELAYKMEFLAHKLSTQYDIAFTKFKPTYYLLGKGKYKIVINIPNLKEADFDSMTVEEINEWLEKQGVEAISSDPSKLKNKKARDERDKAKKARQTSIRKNKEKHYKQWKKPSTRKRK